MVIDKLDKSRGAQINPSNSFQRFSFEREITDNLEWLDDKNQSSYTEVFPKALVNRVDSPDVPANWSMNPYQGCEHGCVYCYARPTHEYWGLSAGKDFESKILVKKNAPQLLEKQLRSKNWKGEAIMLSGNTDCYQPIERDLNITRELLQICLKHKQAVGIITKNHLVCRDLDILEELAALDLVHVHISITTLDEKLRKTLEPRTSTAALRLRTIKELSDANIPTNLMLAPVIPGLNSEEIFKIAEAASDAGAMNMGYTMLRLNGINALLFEDWIRKAFPMKADRVMNLIAMAQGGKVSNNRFGERMKGKGTYAQTIHQQVKLAKTKFLLNQPLPSFKTYKKGVNPQQQLDLF